MHLGIVTAAIRRVWSYAVDVSRGRKTAKEVENTKLMRAFLRRVNDVERSV